MYNIANTDALAGLCCKMNRMGTHWDNETVAHTHTHHKQLLNFVYPSSCGVFFYSQKKVMYYSCKTKGGVCCVSCIQSSISATLGENAHSPLISLVLCWDVYHGNIEKWMLLFLTAVNKGRALAISIDVA